MVGQFLNQRSIRSSGVELSPREGETGSIPGQPICASRITRTSEQPCVTTMVQHPTAVCISYGLDGTFPIHMGWLTAKSGLLRGVRSAFEIVWTRRDQRVIPLPKKVFYLSLLS